MNRIVLCVVCLVVVLQGIDTATVVSLPSLNMNVNDTSVSGLSSGGYMAVQMQVAFSSIMRGAGEYSGLL